MREKEKVKREKRTGPDLLCRPRDAAIFFSFVPLSAPVARPFLFSLSLSLYLLPFLGWFSFLAQELDTLRYPSNCAPKAAG